MKFIVDEMLNSKSECPFSEWKPYPPFMEETGYYICKINKKDCNLCEAKCKLLKEQETVVRCKDCKHYMTIHCTCDGCCISDDWYCANGERR